MTEVVRIIQDEDIKGCLKGISKSQRGKKKVRPKYMFNLLCLICIYVLDKPNKNRTEIPF